ncbi:MlaD family protein [Aldersonia kunmingensis]|uniref:MlaD family protein n=1 Tax=Aldersonia kunmingensis TaxID=408066 RepID=UPI000832A6A3|nr:MlaD family protein [Aldersonia kunmingensis]
MRRIRPGVTIAFTLFVVAMIAAGVVLFEALSPPVEGEQRTYTAQFTDVSGLVVGNDVRELGVRVGKVESIDLVGGSADERSAGSALAQVHFTVTDETKVFDNTQIAVRYLNLVGQRYLDLFVDGAGAGVSPPEQVIPTARTVPSFDVTSLFNGLRPLFKTLEPEQLNTLMQNVLAVVEGRGPDLGSMLEQLTQVSRLASDRSALIGMIIAQLGTVAEQIQYKSPQLNDLISRMGDAFGVLANGAEDTQESLRLASRSLGPVRLLLSSLEDTYYGNYAEVDRLVRKWVPGINSATQLLGRLPGIVASLDATTAVRGQLVCSEGQALPTPMTQVLLAGVPVVLCR